MLNRTSDRRSEIEFVSFDVMAPSNHLLRKIDKAVDFSHIYELTKPYYREDFGRPACDPVVLVKMAFPQHIYGIKSMRQAIQGVEMNMAYRWFLGFSFSSEIPHFATLSYAFTTRFPDDLFAKIFSWILEEVVLKNFLSPKTVFIDATHVKANALMLIIKNQIRY